MKLKIFLSITVVLFLISTTSFPQTKTNIEALNQLSKQFDLEWQQKRARVVAYAQKNNIPIVHETDNGNLVQMIDVENGIPVYRTTHNYEAAQTTRTIELWEGGNTGLELTGEGYEQLGHWDAGKVRLSHQEFTDQGPSRVIWMDVNVATHYHATHTAGTMVAAGISANAQGMAYGGQLKSWEWNNDNSEMASAAAQGLEISNHSYGFVRGWEHNNGNWIWYGDASVAPMEDYRFGFYDANSRALDQIAFNAPNYLIVRSAGNDRGQGPSDAGQGDTPEKDGGDDGYDCIGQEEVSKNVLTVGAVYRVLNYTGPADVRISSFSSWGPADDGRIKPDIVGKGVNVYSTFDGSDTDYGTISGTSMSAPNVSGSCGLLQLHYQNLNGNPMRAATLKGLILHTADEAGLNDGPDYIYGWGLMNAERAANLIIDDQGQNSIDELVLLNNEDYSLDINVPEGAEELRVTISWTDPGGLPVSPSLNPRDPMLVNDLDLKVMDPSSVTHFPYKLDPDNPSNAATSDSENNVDNIEMVVISNPAPGTYTIYIDHDGTLSNGEQAYSLIISGMDEYNVVPECVTALESPGDGAVDVLLNEWLSWKSADYATSYDIYFGTDGGGTQTPTNVYDGENITDNGFSYFMDPSTTYYLQVIPRNNEGTATNCDQIWSLTTMDVIDTFPYFQGMEETNEPELPEYWQAVNLLLPEWESIDIFGHTGNSSMLCYYQDPTTYDNWFISPPFSFESGKEYNVSFYYHSYGGNPEVMKVYWGNSPYYSDLTNLLYEDNGFTGGWFGGNGLFITENDDIVFFGFHVESETGNGVLLDDIKIEDWGTVSIEEKGSTDPKIYSTTDGIVIETNSEWQNASITIYNSSGQLLKQPTSVTSQRLVYNEQLKSGLYIIQLNNKGVIFTKKIIVK